MMEEDVKDFVIRIPSEFIIGVVESEGADGIRKLQKPWSIVAKDETGRFVTMGFEDQSSCADMVANIHKGEAETLFVLKKGIPRKNITIEVKAKFR